MSTGRHSFKHNDAARLIRAAKAAGLTVKGVTLDGSKLTVIADDAPELLDSSNPWEQDDNAQSKRTA